jgi:Kdo2-lipid IVA lauroyltransferase/acyltransferase
MLNLLFTLFSKLPLSWAQRIGAVLGAVIYRASNNYRQKFDQHWGYAKLSGRDDLKQAAIRQNGAMVGEVPFVWTCSTAKILSLVEISEPAQMFLRENIGKPIIFFTPHIGSFEVVGRVLAAHYPMTVLFKPAKRKDVSDIIMRARTAGRMKAVPANLSGVRGLLKALKSNESIGVLPDQVPSNGDGVWVNFFGEPAYTMTLPEKLARSAYASTLVVCTRKPFGEGWLFDLQVLTGPITPQYLNSAIEQAVLLHPTQYLWSYNRYKGQDDVKPQQ